MKNEPHIQRLARCRLTLLKEKKLTLQHKIDELNEDMHLIEMLQVSYYGGCPHCQNEHYPHCITGESDAEEKED